MMMMATMMMMMMMTVMMTHRHFGSRSSFVGGQADFKVDEVGALRNKIHNPNNDHNISIIYKKNTHNGNNDNHKHRPNDNQNNLTMYNHARRADEMRRWYAQTGWGEEMRARDTSLPLQRQASKRGWTLAMRCGGSPRWTGCADQQGCALERNRRHEQAR